VFFGNPAPGEVAGLVDIVVSAAPSENVGSLAVVGAGELVDTDPLPHLFSAKWDTSSVGDGPHTLVAVAVDLDGKSRTAELDVVVRNTPVGTIAVETWFVHAVRGARVELRPVHPTTLAPEAPLAEAFSNEAGVAELVIPGLVQSGLLLIRANGGAAMHATPGGDEALESGEWLEALVYLDRAAPVERVNINPWTTLAASLARHRAATLKGSGESHAATSDSYVARHISRPNAFVLSETPGAPLLAAVGIAVDSESTKLSLASLGLWRLAHDLSTTLGVKLSASGLLGALAQDLSDGLLDGQYLSALSGAALVQVGGKALLDADSTRGTLARAIYEASAELSWNLDQETLFSEGGLYDDISSDTGPLYPKGPLGSPKVPKPAPNPPTIVWLDPTPAQGARVGKAVPFRAQIEDGHGIVALEAVGTSSSAPAVPANLVMWEGVAAVDSSTGKAALALSALDVEGQWLESVRTWVYDDQPPEIVLLAPEEAEFVRLGPLSVRGTLQELPPPSPGEELVSTVELRVVGPRGNGGPPLVLPSVGAEFSAELEISVAGPAEIHIVARDTLGNSSLVIGNIIADDDKPSLTLEGGAAGGTWLVAPGQGAKLSGTARDDTSGVAEVRLWGSKGLVQSVPLGGGAEEPFVITANPAAGESVRVSVVDGAGNESMPVALSVVEDGAPPSVVVAGAVGSVLFLQSWPPLIRGSVADVESVSPPQVWVRVGAGTAPVAAAVEPTSESGVWSFTVHSPGEAGQGGAILEVWALDNAGNTSSTQAYSVKVDTAPPVLTLLPDGGFVDESECAIGVDGALSCPPNLARKHLSPSCPGACGPIRKLPHTWGQPGATPSEVECLQKNIPYLRVAAQDDATSFAPGADPVIFGAFVYEGGPGPTLEIPPSGVLAVSAETLGATSAVLPADLVLPSGLVVWARDPAGNESAPAEVAFSIAWAAPKLPTTAIATPDPVVGTGAPFSFSALTLQLPFASAPQPLTLARHAVHNPLPFPVRASLAVSSAPADWQLTLTAARRLGPSTPTATSPGCDAGSCESAAVASAALIAAQGNAALSTACAPPELAPHVQQRPLPTPSLSLGGAGSQVLLAPGETRTVSMALLWPNSCAIEAPSVVESASAWGSVYLFPLGGGCQTSAEAEGAAAEALWCATGSCPECGEVRAAPLELLEVSIAPESQTTLTLSTSLPDREGAPTEILAHDVPEVTVSSE
jgi:hypothetical protein